LSLPKEVKNSLRTGEISQGHARALLALKDNKRIRILFRKLIKDGLSVRQVENIVKRGTLEPVRTTTIKIKSSKSPQLKAVENNLMMKLGTKVRIRPKGSGGDIVVEYYSNEDLDRLIELIEQIED